MLAKSGIGLMAAIGLAMIASPALAGKPPASACSSISEPSWRAWVNAQPGPGPGQLIIIGTLTLPSGGYDLKLFPVATTLQGKRSVVTVELQITPPSGMAATVMDNREVRLELPAKRPSPMTSQQKQFAAVRVVCGKKLIATIKDISIAW